MDQNGIRGESLKVQGSLTDRYSKSLGNLIVLMYLDGYKYLERIICVENKSSHGLFSVDCNIPSHMPLGYYNAKAKCLGNE